jgi:hypothetical protein
MMVYPPEIDVENKFMTNKFRKLFIRYERIAENYVDSVQQFCGIIVIKKIFLYLNLFYYKMSQHIIYINCFYLGNGDF